MYDFYWYPKCSTCRKAKAQLDSLGIEYREIDLKLLPPAAEKFETWFAQGDFPTKRFFNTSGLVYRELGLKDKLDSLSEAEMAQLLASDGMLIKRPLIVKDGKVRQIGYKEEQYTSLQ
ncbi:arsenate reductase family protein [Lactococcus protaetiae]|uniref:Arsenate reductase family protein n=1 Tax=Lactococcus protaetiae TaxID=2592653 RepID=A0A514Z8J6_9LACT|nr:arsenate reductase family protein [Lactococcus protaetiae]QDK70914.1 arsenate reductase family protein [Lactococcus protaetiae]